MSGKLRAEARNSDYGTTDALPGVVRWGQVSSDRDTVCRGRDRLYSYGKDCRAVNRVAAVINFGERIIV